MENGHKKNCLWFLVCQNYTRNSQGYICAASLSSFDSMPVNNYSSCFLVLMQGISYCPETDILWWCTTVGLFMIVTIPLLMLFNNILLRYLFLDQCLMKKLLQSNCQQLFAVSESKSNYCAKVSLMGLKHWHIR